MSLKSGIEWGITTEEELRNIVIVSKTIGVLNSLAERFSPQTKLPEETLKDIVDAYRGLVQMRSSGRLTEADFAECMLLGMDQFISRGKDYGLLLKTIETFEKMIPTYFTSHKIRQKALEMLARAKTREEVMAANSYAL